MFSCRRDMVNAPFTFRAAQWSALRRLNPYRNANA
jgi:hypothetical protein